MKKTLAIVTGALLLQSACATVVFYEPFASSSYTNGALLGAGVGQWNRGASAGAGCSIVTNTSALSYSGLVTSNGSFGLLRVANSVASNKHAGADLSPSQTIGASNPTLYCSFLMKIQAAPAANRCVLGLSTTTASNPTVGAGVWVNSSSQLLVSKNSTTPAAISTGTLSASTHLVVVRYKYNSSSSDDEVALWFDPAANTFGTNEANVPAFNIATTANTDITSIPAVYAVQGQGSGGAGTVWGSGSGSILMDEIRVGTTWAGVTPPDGSAPPEPPAPSIPVITQAAIATGGFVLRGTNGTTNGIYQVRASPDITRPLGQWDLLSTRAFDTSGNFVCTNPVSPDVPQLFYRLKTGGTLATAPVISGQPQDQSVIVGQDAAFSVIAEGAEPFSYQWYSQSNTPLPGKTSAALAIDDAQENDAGGYFVVVTNSLGAVTSVVATLTVYAAPTNGAYCVATNGSDSNPGSVVAPFLTIPKAISVVVPGDIIYVREGSHFYSQTIRIEKSGTATNPIALQAFPGEHPLLDFANQPYGSNNRGILFTTNGNYWNVKGLEIARAGDNAIKVESSHCTFELLVLHHNGDTGLQIGFGHPAVNNINLAAFIMVINCDSYSNYDPDSNGGDADGFAAKLHCGQGIVFMGCRAWENSDDAWDLFETDASVVISNCWAWKSAPVGQGNGNGFKLGGDGSGGSSKGTHYAYNCASFGHKVNGFTQNSHKDGLVVQHCLSFSNGNSGYNYYMEGSLNSGKQNIFRNNVSIPRTGVNGGGFIADNNPVEQNNTWNLSVTANTADYLSVLEAAAKAPRNPDGSLPTGFARLVSGSDLIDKGVNVGLPFSGSAPDLGPYEYNP